MYIYGNKVQRLDKLVPVNWEITHSPMQKNISTMGLLDSECKDKWMRWQQNGANWEYEAAWIAGINAYTGKWSTFDLHRHYLLASTGLKMMARWLTYNLRWRNAKHIESSGKWFEYNKTPSDWMRDELMSEPMRAANDRKNRECKGRQRTCRVIYGLPLEGRKAQIQIIH